MHIALGKTENMSRKEGSLGHCLGPDWVPFPSCHAVSRKDSRMAVWLGKVMPPGLAQSCGDGWSQCCLHRLRIATPGLAAFVLRVTQTRTPVGACPAWALTLEVATEPAPSPLEGVWAGPSRSLFIRT